jgi:transposase
MVAYSLDLRNVSSKTWQEGQSKNAISRIFKVSLSTVKRYVKRLEQLGHVLPTIQGHMSGKLKICLPDGSKIAGGIVQLYREMHK